MRCSIIISVGCFLLLDVWEVTGHARLMIPPSRNAMWRLAYPVPVNYNDNEVFCGGFGVQQQNDGKCGVCGDNWKDAPPRQHEAGGKYARHGIIPKHYTMGQIMNVEVEITTNHFGYFVMYLCPNNDFNTVVTEECLHQYPLYVVDDEGKVTDSMKWTIPEDTGKTAYVSYKVKLPDGVTCSQCVVQWTWITGNTWGQCSDEVWSIGCGEQETFRNCADIGISSLAATGPIIGEESLVEFMPKDNPLLIVRSQRCESIGFFKSTISDEWCTTNCLKYPSNCPPGKCHCLTSCYAVGEMSKVEGSEVLCQQKCLVASYKTTCPDFCRCV